MKIKTALSATALIAFALASTVSAQDANTPTINQPNQAPTGGNLNEDNAAPRGTVTQNDNRGFNPLWLLPLALLPLLYFMFKRDDRTDEDLEETRSGRYETAYHDIDREEELEDIEDEDLEEGRGRGWFDDSDEHSDAARRSSRRRLD